MDNYVLFFFKITCTDESVTITAYIMKVLNFDFITRISTANTVINTQSSTR